MTRSRQMLLVTILFGGLIGMLAMTDRADSLPMVAVVGGILLGIGWLFYAGDDAQE